MGYSFNCKCGGAAPGETTTSGFADYSNSNPAGNQLSLIEDVFQVMVNDGLGAFTNESFLPSGVTSLWNPSTNQFDFSSLSIGTTVDIRMDATITTLALNQSWRVVLALAVGTPQEYEIEFSSGIRLFSGTSQITRYNGIYIGNEITKNNPAELRIVSNAGATVQIAGWYLKVLTKI